MGLLERGKGTFWTEISGWHIPAFDSQFAHNRFLFYKPGDLVTRRQGKHIVLKLVSPPHLTEPIVIPEIMRSDKTMKSTMVGTMTSTTPANSPTQSPV